MMYRARFSVALSSWGSMRGPQKTLNPECRQEMSILMRQQLPPEAIDVLYPCEERKQDGLPIAA
jgi:hypothetical protein